MDSSCQCLNGQSQSFSFPGEIIDNEEVFYNANNRDMLIQIRWISIHGTEQIPTQLDITIQRSPMLCICKMKLGDREIVPGNLYSKENSLYRGDELIADLTDVYKVYELLGNMFYIPSFRNAINLGSASNYYDIPVGQAFISQWSNWKTGPSKRSQEIGYKVTEDIAEIFEYGKLEINASPDGQRLNTMINGKSYKMSELGTGITQFFLVLASVTMSPSRPSLFSLTNLK